MAHPHALEAPARKKASKEARIDANLERLTSLANAGGTGVNLAAMSHDEIRRRLLKR